MTGKMIKVTIMTVGYEDTGIEVVWCEDCQTLFTNIAIPFKFVILRYEHKQVVLCAKCFKSLVTSLGEFIIWEKQDEKEKAIQEFKKNYSRNIQLMLYGEELKHVK